MGQCTHKLGNGERCRNQAIKGRSTCYLTAHSGGRWSIAKVWNWAVNNKPLAFCLTVLGVILGVIALVPSFTSKISGLFSAPPPFTTKVDACLCSPNRGTGGFYIVYGRLGTDYLAPVNLLVHMAIVNTSGHPVVIDAYGLEAKTEDGRWAPLVRVRKLGAMYYAIKSNPLTGRLISDDSLFLDPQLDGKTVQSYETVQGWASFEYPRAFNGAIFQTEFRVTVHTFSGIDYTSDPQSPLPDDARQPLTGVQRNGLIFLPNIVDLSGYSVKFYDDALTESQLPR